MAAACLKRVNERGPTAPVPPQKVHSPSKSFLVRWPYGEKQIDRPEAIYPATERFNLTLDALAMAHHATAAEMLERLIGGETLNTPAYNYKLVLRAY